MKRFALVGVVALVFLASACAGSPTDPNGGGGFNRQPFDQTTFVVTMNVAYGTISQDTSGVWVSNSVQFRPQVQIGNPGTNGASVVFKATMGGGPQNVPFVTFQETPIAEPPVAGNQTVTTIMSFQWNGGRGDYDLTISAEEINGSHPPVSKTFRVRLNW